MFDFPEFGFMHRLVMSMVNGQCKSDKHVNKTFQIIIYLHNCSII